MKHSVVNFLGCDLKYLESIPLVKWRADGLHEKEPYTNKWLKNLPEAAMLIDVGANVGFYSLYAAKAKGARVIALEPHALTFGILQYHIQLNGLSHLITAYPIGASNISAPMLLHINQNEAGGSCHALGESVDFHGNRTTFAYSQGSYGIRLDELCEHLHFPATHLKIDVDGFDHKVIEGAIHILPSIESIIIETNHNMAEHQKMMNWLRNVGFVCDEEQVEGAKRKSGTFKDIGEVVWTRKK